MIPSRVYDPETTPLKGLFLLEASAGTGKTYALERMVTRLVGRDIDPMKMEDILVVTFTNRAAREMKERIRSLLSLRLKEAGRTETERDRYRLALSGFDKAPIYTIHGFCQMVLSSWPFESSSPFRQELIPGGVMESGEVRSWISGLQEADVDRELMRTAYLRSRGIENLIKGISDSIVKDNIPPGATVLPTISESAEFADYVESSSAPGSPLDLVCEALFSRDWSNEAIRDLHLAGAGKKKTAPSLERISSHMKACRGVRGLMAVSEAVFGDPAGVGVKNHFLEVFHSGVVVDDSLKNRQENGEDIDLSHEARELAAAFAGLFHEWEPYIEFSHSADKSLISLTEPYMECAFSDLARETVEESLEKLKDRTGKWGYADLIRRVADKVSEPDSPLLPVLRTRFRAALIDEFQDTDPRQWNLFKTVFGNPETGHILALIGDPKQSIYGFRGTGLQAYNAARLSVPDSRLYRLDTNYRSRPSLVAASNRFFAPLFREPRFEAVIAGKTDSDELCWEDSSIPVSFFVAESRQQGAAMITAEIRGMLDPSSGAEWKRADGLMAPVSASDIAVLVRGKLEEDDLLRRLALAGIPAVQIRSRPLMAIDLVRVVAGLLDAIDSPRKTALWRSVLLDSFFALPPDLLVLFEENGYLDEFVEQGNFWHGLFLSGRSTEAFEAFFSFSSNVGRWTREAGQEELGLYLEQPWPRRILSEPDGTRQWQDWRHISELIQKRQSEGVREISGIKTWMNSLADNPDPEGREDAVRLDTEAPAVRVLTMHTAKGLEFPLVFLHGGYGTGSARRSDGDYRFDNQGKLVVDRVRRESNRTAHLAYEWEEDKRLWYVAFTRASVKVWIPLPVDGAVTQVESLIDGALNGVRELPPHQTVPKKEAGVFRQALRSGLESWCREEPCLFSVTREPDLTCTPLEKVESPELRAAELPEQRLSDRDPVTSSYTSLIRFASGETRGESARESDERDDKDVDGLSVSTPAPVAAENGVEPLPLSADRGALFGTLVHALLEESNFEKVKDCDEEDWQADTETEDLFLSLSRRYYPPDWYRPRGRTLKAIVRSALRCEIPGLGRLCDIESGSLRHELEFHLAIPRRAELTSENLKMSLARGYLKGFIDLLLNDGKRWWVVDWKTNVPPGTESAESYDPPTIKEIMDHHHYHLQYELYLLALCRTLSGNLKRPVEWDNEIGGAAYLFVRGTREGDDRGVFVQRPPLDRMLSLASEMGLSGVIE